MNDASWALSAFLTVGFFIAGIATSFIGWYILAVGMVVVTIVRFNAARRPPPD